MSIPEGPKKEFFDDMDNSALFTAVAPRWLSEPQDVNVSRGSESRFDCVGFGIPPPRAAWAKFTGSLVISNSG